MTTAKIALIQKSTDRHWALIFRSTPPPAGYSPRKYRGQHRPPEFPLDVVDLVGEGGPPLGEVADLACRGGSFRASSGVGVP